MPKALELSDDAFMAPAVPRAAQVASNEPPPAKPVRAGESPRKKPAAKAPSATKYEKHVPLQLRWPRSEVKAAKLAAMQGDYDSVSEFMLACLHAYMQEKKG